MKAELLNAWAGFWEVRTPREKALLTWGGAVLAVVIVWSVLWAPAQEGRARIQRELPSLQRQLSQMTAQANEARSLSAAACCSSSARSSCSTLRDRRTRCRSRS